MALDNPIDRPVRLLAIGGSVREHSRTRAAMDAILSLASDAIIPTAVTVRDLDLPNYNDDLPFDQQPAALQRLVEQVREADAYLLCSPTYHGSMTGAFKNVLDALHIMRGEDDAWFNQRPVGITAYGGPSAINVVNTLQPVVRAMRGIVVPTVVTVSRDTLDASAGVITDEKAQRRARRMLDEIVELVAMQRARQSSAATSIA